MISGCATGWRIKYVLLQVFSSAALVGGDGRLTGRGSKRNRGRRDSLLSRRARLVCSTLCLVRAASLRSFAGGKVCRLVLRCGRRILGLLPGLLRLLSGRALCGKVGELNRMQSFSLYWSKRYVIDAIEAFGIHTLSQANRGGRVLFGPIYMDMGCYRSSYRTQLPRRKPHR